MPVNFTISLAILPTSDPNVTAVKLQMSTSVDPKASFRSQLSNAKNPSNTGHNNSQYNSPFGNFLRDYDVDIKKVMSETYEEEIGTYRDREDAFRDFNAIVDASRAVYDHVFAVKRKTIKG